MGVTKTRGAWGRVAATNRLPHRAAQDRQFGHKFGQHGLEPHLRRLKRRLARARQPIRADHKINRAVLQMQPHPVGQTPRHRAA
jgi:hypothetical protein